MDETSIISVLVVLVVVCGLVILYAGQFEKSPKWVHRTSFRIRFVLRWVVIGLAVVGIFMLLWEGAIEAAIWLAPENRYGYAFKYETNTVNQIFIQPEPHDCEWGKSPIGKKYCHFEKRVTTEKDEHDSTKVKAVYVSWEKVED